MASKQIKIEDHCRNQVVAYLEVSKQTPIDLCKRIQSRTGEKLTPPTVYNWIKRESSMKVSNLELIIDQMRLDGYEFTI